MKHAPKNPDLLFSRYCDGSRVVRVVADGWEVGNHTFTTRQGLLAELTGHPTGRHWSFERYFGLGRHAKKHIGQANVFELFPPPVASPPSLPPRTEVMGIDLATRGDEVRKLLFAGFGRKIFSAGYDPDDVLQEVYRGLLARNKGTCPWDPKKSSFGHYVHMVCGCVLSNYHRKQRRRKQFEQIGMLCYQDGEYKIEDAASNTTVPAHETEAQGASQFNEATEDLVAFIRALPSGGSANAHMAIRVMPYVAGGTRRAIIAKELGVSMASINRAVSFLRTAAAKWRDL